VVGPLAGEEPEGGLLVGDADRLAVDARTPGDLGYRQVAERPVADLTVELDRRVGRAGVPGGAVVIGVAVEEEVEPGRGTEVADGEGLSVLGRQMGEGREERGAPADLVGLGSHGT